MPRRQQPVGAVVQADAHGHRIGQPRRDHERRRDDLQGDLVRAQFGTAHGPHAQRGEGEQADFHGVGPANRQAQAPQLAQRRHRWPRQVPADRVGRIGRVLTDIQRQGHRHAVGDDRRHQADTHQPQLRQAEHALDQRVIEQEVDHRPHQADDHHRRRAPQRTGKTAQGHEGQVAGQGEGQQQQEVPGILDVAGCLPEQQQYRPEVPQHQRRHHRHDPAQPQPGLGQAGGAFGVAGAMTDGDQGTDRGDHPEAEDRHERIARRTQAAAGQGLGADPGHHQGVGEQHQHMRQLRGNQRPRQPQQCLEFMGWRRLHGRIPRKMK
ncbi:hypothetical protein PSEMO_18360 [Pseudomonas putida]|uniref:Uncharacterized protein n=1 Tax=Pseudomonas putida TaxID=303 RepID=A0A1Q9R6Z0_PSEPU|nr:hypothetical protein PSEMO_18360 [Pseudomonas putida]